MLLLATRVCSTILPGVVGVVLYSSLSVYFDVSV